MKVGKAFDQNGSPLGETFKEVSADRYQKIPRSREHPVFPGYLSWWGVDVRDWMDGNNDDGSEFLERIRDNHDERQYAPGYLAEDTGSPYGNKAFSIRLEDILRDYQSSRSIHSKITLRIGGTLRYRYEICYIVMVSLKNDNLQNFLPISRARPPLNPNGITDARGVVVNYKAIPRFKIQSTVRCELDGGYEYYDWENLAFCFYFPNEHQRLRCTNVSVSDICHDPPMCIATIPTEDGRYCPNDLGRPKVN